MRKRLVVIWRRLVVVKREEPEPPSFDFHYRHVVPATKWGLWRRIKYRITGKGFPPYVPGVVRRERVTLRRRLVLLFSRKPPVPPPRPVLVTAVAVGAVRTGARREPWRWWMLFTRRGADMTIPEWIEDKKLAWMDWPLTWKLGMALPGILAGWLIHLQTGWNYRYCVFTGGLIGLFTPLIVLNMLEAAFVLFVLGLMFGSLYWAFQDTEFMQGLPQFFGAILGFIWGLILAAWKAIFG